MLIAMSLLAVIMMLLFSGLRVGVRSWDRGEARAASFDQKLVVQGFIRARLSGARLVYDDFSDDERIFGFIGASDSISFVATLPAHIGHGGLQKFRLYSERNGPANDLMVAIEPFFPVFDDDSGINETVVLTEGVKELRIAYYGPEEGGDDELQWMDEWSERESLPNLVKLEITFMSGETWPPIGVELRVNGITTGSVAGRGGNPFLETMNRQRQAGQAQSVKARPAGSL